MTLEQDFAAWVDRRDGDALARVFDATAGKLSLLAAHVAGGAVDAADLVQATFVVAMTRGATWDRARPLEPWLAGVLYRELLQALRRGRRRREVGFADGGGARAGRGSDGRDGGAENDDGAVAPAHGAAAPEPGPARTAATAEAVAAVLAAVDALPLPYRQVLRLRLVHGLRPVEIARALEAPVGTVRAQLHRGLEQLRAALPAGVGAALAALCAGEGALLAQVRATLLATAARAAGDATAASAGAAAAAVVATSTASLAPSAGAPGAAMATSKLVSSGAAATFARTGATAARAVPGAITTAGGLAMQGKAILGAAVGCAVLVLVLFVLRGPDAWLAAPAAPEAARRAESTLTTPAATARSPSPASPRVDAAPTTPAPAWPLEVTVRDGRGAPLAGADVRVWTTAGGGVLSSRPAPATAREELTAGVTGPDGVFSAALDALRERSAVWLGGRDVWIEARAANAEPAFRGERLRYAPERVAVTLELRPGSGIRGRVVDAAGGAVRGAQVAPAGSDHGASTDVDGTFFLRCGGDGARPWPTALVVWAPAHGAVRVAIPTPASGAAARSGAASAANTSPPPVAAPPELAATGAPAAPPARVVDVGDVRLASDVAVHGRVVLGDGTGVSGVEVRLEEVDAAVAGDLAATRRWLFDRSQRSATAPIERGGRLVLASARVDAADDGSFRFAGLAPDAHYLLDVWAIGEPGRVVMPSPDAADLCLDMQVVAFDLVDERGESVAPAPIALDGYDPTNARPSWRPRPGFPTTGQVCGNWTPSGDAHDRPFVLSPFGMVWCVHTRDDALQPFSVRHEALPGVHRATCPVVVRAEARFGTLQFTAVDARGARVPCGALLRALDRDAGHDLRGLVEPTEGFRQRLPAGRWEVEAVFGRMLFGFGSDGVYTRGRHRDVVVVEPGATVERVWQVPPGGVVALQLHSATPPGEFWRDVRVHCGGRALELWVRSDDPKYPTAARPGATFATLDALPPGRHRLVVEADGYQPATCDVDVVDDQVVHARVELFAR